LRRLVQGVPESGLDILFFVLQPVHSGKKFLHRRSHAVHSGLHFFPLRLDCNHFVVNCSHLLAPGGELRAQFFDFIAIADVVMSGQSVNVIPCYPW